MSEHQSKASKQVSSVQAKGRTKSHPKTIHHRPTSNSRREKPDVQFSPEPETASKSVQPWNQRPKQTAVAAFTRPRPDDQGRVRIGKLNDLPVSFPNQTLTLTFLTRKREQQVISS